MRKNVISLVLFAALAGLFIGCAPSMNLRAHDVALKKGSQDVPVYLELVNLPGNFFAKGIAPAGNIVAIENKAPLDSSLRMQLERILQNKGYIVVNEKEKSRVIVTVDFQDFDFTWNSKMVGMSYGKIKMGINHNLRNVKRSDPLWTWQYDYDAKHGKMVGNLWAMIPVIGLPALIIYGSEGAQLTEAGEKVLDQYFAKFEAELPPTDMIKRGIR